MNEYIKFSFKCQLAVNTTTNIIFLWETWKFVLTAYSFWKNFDGFSMQTSGKELYIFPSCIDTFVSLHYTNLPWMMISMIAPSDSQASGQNRALRRWGREFRRLGEFPDYAEKYSFINFENKTMAEHVFPLPWVFERTKAKQKARRIDLIGLLTSYTWRRTRVGDLFLAEARMWPGIYRIFTCLCLIPHLLLLSSDWIAQIHWI